MVKFHGDAAVTESISDIQVMAADLSMVAPVAITILSPPSLVIVQVFIGPSCGTRMATIFPKGCADFGLQAERLVCA